MPGRELEAQQAPSSATRLVDSDKQPETLGGEVYGDVSWDSDSLLGHDVGRGLCALYEKIPR